MASKEDGNHYDLKEIENYCITKSFSKKLARKNPSLYILDFSVKAQNIKSFSSLIPSYLLKVTKFLVKISQFEFLVMTERNIFVYKLFLPLNI